MKDLEAEIGALDVEIDSIKKDIAQKKQQGASHAVITALIKECKVKMEIRSEKSKALNEINDREQERVKKNARTHYVVAEEKSTRMVEPSAQQSKSKKHRELKVVGIATICVILSLVALGPFMSRSTLNNTQSYLDNKAKIEAQEEQDLIQQRRDKAKEESEQHLRKNSITPDNYIEIVEHSKDYIRQQLKSPSTARFQGSLVEPLEGWVFQPINNHTVRLSSFVDSQNSFGGDARTSFIVTVCQRDGRLMPRQQ